MMPATPPHATPDRGDIDKPLMSDADWARLHESAKLDADKPRRQCLACGVSFEDNGRDFCGPTCKAHRG